MELDREQTIKDLQEIVDNYSGSWQRFNVLDSALTLIKELIEENARCAVLIGKEGDFQLRNLPEELFGHPEPVGDKGICGLYRQCQADTIRKMQSMIKEECLAGGIYPAFVASVVERVGKKLLEDIE